eukprot:TRINITY_DN23768_c0_g1_i1.p1 TRINITY_DN23768_c0_g1~~TRINITY_DN23768_c0_g1_i1.p1  ORF type:complete len:331 (+),score=70.29 TRINITY_DN23768_c0_g1_i1:184-1176(+)
MCIRDRSDILRRMEEEDIARCNRGALHKATILPGFVPDKHHWGHSPLRYHGPRDPPEGNSIGGVEMLGSCDSELHIRNAAKSMAECRKYIELGLDVNARDTSSFGCTALHFAAKWDRVEIMKLLMEYKADPLLRNWEGQTPLVVARKRGNYAFVRALQDIMDHAREQEGQSFGREQPHTSQPVPECTDSWYSLPDGIETVAASKPSPSKHTSHSVTPSFDQGLEQVMALAEQFHLLPTEVQQIQAGFKEWDQSHSGAISLADIEKVMTRSGLEFSATDTEGMARMVDENGLITFEAFLEASANRIKKLRRSRSEGTDDIEGKLKQQRLGN